MFRYFNPRPLAGATYRIGRQDQENYISIHAPSRGRLKNGWQDVRQRDFNPRPLAGATITCCAFSRLSSHFNPRPLAGATCSILLVTILSSFQSTPPRGGDLGILEVGRVRSISIHAPSRGRRAWFPAGGTPGVISIHAPSRGRQYKNNIKQKQTKISIHAPSRGRRIEMWTRAGTRRFQSTPPRGGDGSGCRFCHRAGNFNPRPLAGATSTARPLKPTGLISIHAPSRGRLIFFRKRSKIIGYFNPRPLAGATVRRGSQIPSDVPVFFSRRSVFRFPKPRYPVLFLSVCFPFALTAPWGLQGRKSFWLPGAGFCSDRCCPGCRTAGCRGLCR